MTELTLASIEQGLQQPFAPEDVKYLPKSPKKKETGEWVCLALPYADKRAYEDRLNDLAFGYWSTPYNPPYAVGNKLVIPVTVTVFDVEHTDYGEAFLSSVSRKGELQEAENSATEAYSQGFRRACAQFRLGRYFYSLPKVWVPYDPATRTIAFTAEQKYQLTLRLYKRAGLLVSGSRHTGVVVGAKEIGASATGTPHSSQESGALESTAQEPSVSKAAPTSLTVQPQSESVTVAPDSSQEPPHASPDQAVPSEGGIPHFDLKEQKRRWLELQLEHNQERIQRICEQYQVQSLDQLSETQFVHLANRIFAAQKRAQQKNSGTAPAKRVVSSSVRSSK
jgi:hypothetical protein